MEGSCKRDKKKIESKGGGKSRHSEYKLGKKRASILEKKHEHVRQSKRIERREKWEGKLPEKEYKRREPIGIIKTNSQWLRRAKQFER